MRLPGLELSRYYWGAKNEGKLKNISVVLELDSENPVRDREGFVPIFENYFLFNVCEPTSTSN